MGALYDYQESALRLKAGSTARTILAHTDRKVVVAATEDGRFAVAAQRSVSWEPRMDKQGRLVVDIHCHVFSGKDIPLREFAHYGHGVPMALARIIEWAVNRPTGTSKQARAASLADSKKTERSDLDDRNAIEAFLAYGKLMGRSVHAIAALMLADFPQVDLFTPAITDMDCWLGDASFYDDRVAEHAKLAEDKKWKGRVHPIIGFDPVRQHATRQAFGAGNDHVQQVRKAIEQDGFVGVKVYPPMGFRPAGNTLEYPGGTQVTRPRNKPLRCMLERGKKSVPVEMTGADLDTAMDQLFTYCAAEEVPVMVHCTPHGAESEKGRGLNSDPRHWRPVLQKFPELRLNLAHYGGASGRPSFTQAALELTVRNPHVYGDVGAHDLVNDSARGRAIWDSYSYELNAALEDGLDFRKKIMFGTDWHTTFVDPNPRAYVKNYLAFYDEEISQGVEEVKVDFRADNALRYLGLHKSTPNSKARKRLEAFYRKHGIFELDGKDQPRWW